MVVTNFLLFQALAEGGSLMTTDGHFKLVTRLERLDGSTHTFVVTGTDDQGRKFSVEVRTLD